MCAERRQRGLTLVELIVFIVIVGVALAGVLTVLNHTTRHSADPLVRKQALAIAEAILEEVMLQPFTWCDPDDPTAATATNYSSAPTCTVATNREIGAMAEPGEARGSPTSPLDNVNDYHGLSTTTNVAGGGAAPYTATVTAVRAALHDIGSAANDSPAILVTVTVTAPGETIALQGYRTRHSPNLLP